MKKLLTYILLLCCFFLGACKDDVHVSFSLSNINVSKNNDSKDSDSKLSTSSLEKSSDNVFTFITENVTCVSKNRNVTINGKNIVVNGQ